MEKENVVEDKAAETASQSLPTQETQEFFSKNLVDFFGLLLEVDKRTNPDLYQGKA